MAFQIDTSGIHSASTRLEVIGNNISNSNTVGFKGSEFDDVLATSMSGSVGTKKAGTRQSFSQGNITASSNPLDMAINGKGFFRVEAKGVAAYTRNGQFQLNKAGAIVNSTGDKLTGYGVDKETGLILSGSPVALSINPDPYAPRASTGITLDVTLDIRDDAMHAPSITTAFIQSDPTTYSHSTTTTLYDASGAAHDLQTFYVKRSPTDWDVYASLDNTMTPAAPATWATLAFDGSGKLTTASDLAARTLQVPVSASQSVNFDLSSAVQYGTSFAATVDQHSSDLVAAAGAPPGEMTGYKIGNDGIITASYSNGRFVTMGQVVLADFKNTDGLAPTENNQWMETAASGAANLNVAGGGGMGLLEASATEDANIDLTAEMIKMISAQRVFQAAAEMVKKQDQIMQTVVSIGQ